MDFTPQELFRQGAEAMRARLVSVVMLNGQTDLAIKLLQTNTPPYQLSETQTIDPKG